MHRPPSTIERLESLGGRTDGQLLERFRSEAPASPAATLAFEALVARHGPMVLRACRWALGDRHAAEDAFQVTFLALARQAGSIRDRDSVASWLLGVARRSAARIRRAESRRVARERRRGISADGSPRGPEARDDLGSRVLDELARLPEPQRAAVVLCYLEGHTCEDAARILGWPVGTVKSRLARARDRLRDRLGPPSLLLAPPIPPRLADATVRLAGLGSSLPAETARLLAPTAPGATMLPILAPWKWPALALAAGLGLTFALAGPGEPPAQTVQEQPPPKPQAPVAPPRVPRELMVRAGSGSAVLYKLNERGERVRVNQPRRGMFEEEVRPIRWVAVVATLDHRAAIAAEALDRKLDPAAIPKYVRVDVERQSRSPAGEWSEWAPVDHQRNYEILDNMPVGDTEYVPEPLRPTSLVDPLPFLKVGTWTTDIPKSLARMIRFDFDRSDKDSPAKDAMKDSLTSTGPISITPHSNIDPSKGSTRATLIPDSIAANQGHLGPPTLLIRHLDFTVEPETTYRYRLRVVVRNPDQGPKVMNPPQVGPQIPGQRDRRVRQGPPQPPRELFWPWSDPSPEVKAL